jgi:3-methyladenine DNA glycosylase AlkD
MPRARIRKPEAGSLKPVQSHVQKVLAWLQKRGTRRNREGMARYGIVARHVFGVSVADIRALARTLGRDHDLALALWDTGWHEARLLTAFVDDPSRVTAAQMDRWVKDFDNWAVCDGLCFHLFDKTPHAWRKIELWSGRREEFVKRAAFALLVGVGLHDKTADDSLFEKTLPLIERAASDDRNYVKKGVSWALRVIGRRSVSLNVSAVALAERLTTSAHPGARWVGRDAYRELTSAAVQGRLARKKAGPQGAGLRGRHGSTRLLEPRINTDQHGKARSDSRTPKAESRKSHGGTRINTESR